jgi:steroid 5-alpha reductase family enzyme
MKRLGIVGFVVFFGVLVSWLAGGGSGRVMGVSTLVWCCLFSFSVQWLAAIPAIVRKTEVFYDLVGSLTYLSMMGCAAWFAYMSGRLDVGRVVLVVMVCVWALRLGTFLARRIHRTGKDDRFVVIKQSPLRFLIAWTLQGLWVFLTSLAVLVLVTDRGASEAIGWVHYVGWAMWGMGFGIEVVADAQKSAFNTNPANKGRWIDVGLWRYAQHPNYFGEILLWLGLFVSGMGSYRGWQWLAVLSPLFVFFLLTRVSGIPMLQERATQKWGDDPAFQAYRKKTNLLIPGPSR